MTTTMVLETLSIAGVELFVKNGKLCFRAMEGAYTPELRALVDNHRGQLLAWLTTAPCPRCRSTEWRDVSIHDGLSVRRDCAKCGRYLSFPLWYGVSEAPGRRAVLGGVDPPRAVNDEPEELQTGAEQRRALLTPLNAPTAVGVQGTVVARH